MDNYLKEFIEEYHLSNEGNMTWGEVHQFQMAMKMGTEMYSGYVYRTYVFSKIDEEQKNKMQSFLADNKKILKMSEIKTLDFGVYFAIPSVTQKKGYALVKEALEAITKFMLENEFKTKEYCPLCGEVMENQKQITIDDGYPMIVDEACGAQYQQELE